MYLEICKKVESQDSLRFNLFTDLDSCTLHYVRKLNLYNNRIISLYNNSLVVTIYHTFSNTMSYLGTKYEKAILNYEVKNSINVSFFL